MNIVLVEPDIPWNTGNIGRTCVGTGTALHLVGKLGFSLKDKFLKRAGLDYWDLLDVNVHSNWDAFIETENPDPQSLIFFEKDASKDFWNADFSEECFLVFGAETTGFPQEILKKYNRQFYKIPMSGPVRSLNLSSAVAIALYEGIRQVDKKVMTY